MRQVSSMSDKQKDSEFGQVKLTESTNDEDQHEGIDIWLSRIPFAWRKRRIHSSEHGQISIRYARRSGAKTEFRKLLDGDIKALVYIFEFTDCAIICRVCDIIECLCKGRYEIQYNKDSITAACYINLADLLHLKVDLPKDEAPIEYF